MPKRQKPLAFALPDIGEEEIAEVTACLKSGWLTTGPKTLQFENNFAEFVGTKYALAVNSATAGLHLSLEAIGIGPGDKVITSTYTFTASAEVIRYLGADPIFVDIDYKTFNISPEQIRQVLRDNPEKIKAILPVHFAGQACAMNDLKAIAQDHDLKIVEDAAHALPCTYDGQMIGGLGDATVFSFYATKPIATGEGGMVTTDSEEIAKRIKLMRLHGINRDVWDRYTSEKPNWYYEVIEPGYKYNLTDIMSAMGIHQLKKANLLQSRREFIAQKYTEAFSDLPLETPFVSLPGEVHAWHLYVIKLQLDKINISRDDFINELAACGIGCSVHFIPLHLHPYWRNLYNLEVRNFPVAMDSFNRVVSLPIYTRMTDEDIERVIASVRTVLIKHGK